MLWIPINLLMIDPVTRFDTRLSKVIPIGERMKVYLSFEVFISRTPSATWE